VSGSDKTEAPTPKRKREARKEGRIAKSPELSTWGAVLLASFVLPMTLASSAKAVRDLLAQTGEVIARPNQAEALGLLGVGGRALIAGVTPVALAMVVFAVLANVAQTGGVVAPKRLKPKAEHINPLKGFKRLFSKESGWNTVKVLVRTLVLAGAAWLPLQSAVQELGTVEQPRLRALIGAVGTQGLQMVRLVAVAGLLLGVLDFVVVKRRLVKSLRMTKQEVRDEHRQSEGDPFVRGQIRARQREMSRNRMIAAVADASVVIVNPTHVAVALRYEPGGGAPRLVAKGRGEVARRIREEAERHQVAMVRDVPLARALHDSCDLDQPIPAELYEAVAKVLAFVFTVGKRASAFGGVLVAR
jgi:flagellar biosynthetic protein FlhB